MVIKTIKPFMEPTLRHVHIQSKKEAQSALILSLIGNPLIHPVALGGKAETVSVKTESTPRVNPIQSLHSISQMKNEKKLM